MRIDFLIDGVRVYGEMQHNEFQPFHEYQVVDLSEMYTALRQEGLPIVGQEKADFATWAEWVESSGRLDAAAFSYLDNVWEAPEHVWGDE